MHFVQKTSPKPYCPMPAKGKIRRGIRETAIEQARSGTARTCMAEWPKRCCTGCLIALYCFGSSEQNPPSLYKDGKTFVSWAEFISAIIKP